ncbi:tetratricopeptide repeat protein [Stigmatella sp. ncwal1]|uniref:Tetratricopeptide repeat protein n=1 Tax=Stigmatella ashevillensis TaxID=2995309 RepID=A0ABT5D299_9BACT|nr:tetratricopeptide repeat protein [Stigmatella ashevillena]MDC0707199.1 tetratricopeptide repeat protein [Stigmatella ashevillena]
MVQSELYRRGYEQLKAGNYDEAKRLFLAHEEKAGTAAETQALLRQAAADLAKSDLDGAAKRYEQLLERNPSLPEIYLGLTRISLFLGQLDAARVHATAAVRLGPELGLAWTLLGLVHEAEGDVAGALPHLSKATGLSPSVFLCQFNHGRVLGVAGRPTEAIAPLTRAIELEPGNPDGFYTLGIVYKQARQYENSLRSFEKAKDLAPKNVDYWATLADVLFEVKEFQAARDILDRGLAACGEHPALLEKALATAMMLSDNAGAIRYVERELKVVPNHEQGWINLANLTLLEKDFDKSEKAARELLKRNPKSWEAWFHLGNLFEAVPHEAKAEEAYRNAIELAPDNWKPLTNLAGLLIQMESRAKNAEAIPLLEQAAMLAPKGEWRVQYNLALAYTKLGKRERALEIARRIVREAPPGDATAEEARKLESNLLEAAR